jgi:DtxR family Mn-dependent transcriptional regulator
MRGEGETVTNARLADWLGVSRPTVTAALRRMARDGLVSVDPHEIRLTASGDQRAAAVVRRHRVVERWLVDALGLDWVAADEEAARLEHAVSDVVEAALYEALGRPSTCPHGNPIPGRSEAPAGEVRLSALTEGGAAQVTRISEVAEREAPPLLRYLAERRLVPRAQVAVAEVDSVARTLRLRVGEGDGEVTVSHDTAAKIWVLPTAS